MRTRAGFSWPEPDGITQGAWSGDNSSFYQRFRFTPGNWEAVLLTEKDPGEDWGDLITGGVRFTGSEFSVSAGALRTQFSRGLTFANSGGWSSADPLSLSKPPAWRMRMEPAESPGVTDGSALTGAGTIWNIGELSIACAAGWSWMDHSGSGLHRSLSEMESRHDTEEKLAALRAGWGPAGITFATVAREGSDSTSSTRFGADIDLASGCGRISGEIAMDTDSTLNFSFSAQREQPDLRHCLTVSRNQAEFPRSSGAYGSTHRLGAGYGARWRVSSWFTADAGALYLLCSQEDRFRTGFLLSERAGSRLEFTQRVKFSMAGDERTTGCRLTAGWSPGARLTLSLKVPFTFYSNPDEESQSGCGVEIRLKQKLSPLLEYTVSAAAASTDGWQSRVYAYSLSFPGEFGSTALYGNSVLLQGWFSLHISDAAAFRARVSRYCRDGAEYLGSGSEETDGPCRTSAGCQLDWSF